MCGRRHWWSIVLPIKGRVKDFAWTAALIAKVSGRLRRDFDYGTVVSLEFYLKGLVDGRVVFLLGYVLYVIYMDI